MKTRIRATLFAAMGMLAAILLSDHPALAQLCGGPGVLAPQCDGQCPFGQMCADTGSGCGCMPATIACGNPANPNGPPVCWGGCPSATMVCATFAGGCMCLQGPILCGNGAPDPGEGCDDGNTANGDGCDENCTLTGCGNDVATAGEECDGTDDAACFAGCQAGCTCAAAPPSTAQIKCFMTIAKEGGKFVKGRLMVLQKCRDQNLKVPGSCAAPDPVGLAALEAKLAAGLDKQCGLDTAALDNMGFPGRCSDANPLDGFTNADLQGCIRATHVAATDAIMEVEYDSTIVGPLGSEEQQCQRALAQTGSQVLVTVLKSVQKCRNAILRGKLTGLPPEACATLDLKTAAKIAKIVAKAESTIAGSCSPATVMSLKACTPDQVTASAAATCITATHADAADDPDVTDPADVIDYEYATQPVCGDHVTNQPAEECDGPDDDVLCPGLCEAACTCP
jgi:cysteine-rich repeat protein